MSNWKRIVLTLGALLMSSGGARPAIASTGVQLTPDAKRLLVSADVGPERWAITLNEEDQTVTGNVFLTNGAPLFVSCTTVEIVGAERRLTCFGADHCHEAPCGGGAWTSLGEVRVSESYFSPRAGGASGTKPARGSERRSGSSDDAPSGLQITPDGQRILISKDVGGERWAITYHREDGSITGNVFRGADSPPAFVWCEELRIEGGGDPNRDHHVYACYGAGQCTAEPCEVDDWSSISEVRLQGSFLREPHCGDGSIQPGEACDDGNGFDGDGCSSECRIPACGDGFCSAAESCSTCSADCGSCGCPDISGSWAYSESGTVSCQGDFRGTFPAGGAGAAWIDQSGCDVAATIDIQGASFTMQGRIEGSQASLSGSLISPDLGLPPFIDVDRADWNWTGAVDPNGFALSSNGNLDFSGPGIEVFCSVTGVHRFSR